MKCICGFFQPDDFNFCVNCGNQLKNVSKTSDCKHKKDGLFFCPDCGRGDKLCGMDENFQSDYPDL